MTVTLSVPLADATIDVIRGEWVKVPATATKSEQYRQVYKFGLVTRDWTYTAPMQTCNGGLSSVTGLSNFFTFLEASAESENSGNGAFPAQVHAWVRDHLFEIQQVLAVLEDPSEIDTNEQNET